MVVYLRKSIHSLLSVFKKKAGPKGNEDQKKLAVHYTASQHYQENVFIEGSRPQYLEALHTEAQEGLKILQQEEHKNGVNFPDDESIASTDTLRPEQDISSQDQGDSPDSRSTTENNDITVPTAMSTRPLPTRQGSTFKPLNPVKRLDKNRRRSRRTTIMGIPNQVHKELAVHRSSTFQPLATQHSNHNGQVNSSQPGVIVIPTVDGGTPVENKEGARVHLSELEASRGEQLLWKHLQAVYQDEPPITHHGFGSHLCPTSSLRPKSVAVPGMTTSTMLTFLQEPQGPVMSISPQATYLSTIIPNAVLPASIEVIEIDRSSSVNHCNSVRTVSKSSLASGDSSVSPLLSRRSDGDSSQADHCPNDTIPMPISASESNCGESQSSKTLVSNSSPVSSKGSTRSDNSQSVGLNGDQDLVSLRSSISMISSPSSKNKNIFTGLRSESGVSESVTAGNEVKNKQNFNRGLSVMKTKQPPAPPRRTNSLHTNKIRSNPRTLVDNKDLNNFVSGELTTDTENTVERDEIKLASADTSPIPNCESNSAGTSTSPTQASSGEAIGAKRLQSESSSSSPQKTPSDGGKFERTMSPSSGYSSQSGTPTLSPKGISPTSPDKQKEKPVKPERSVSWASSSAASPSSSLTSLSSGSSEPVSTGVSTHSPSLPPQGSPNTVSPKELNPNNNFSSLRAEFRELLNIPPPPKVKAPCPPPPETWVHNRRTFELLCGPCPSVIKVTQTPEQIPSSTVKQTGAQTESSKEVQILVEKQITTENSPLELSESKAKPGTLNTMDSEDVHKELEARKCPHTEQEKVEECTDFQMQKESNTPVAVDPVSQVRTPKKAPPPVMKKPMIILPREELVSTEHSVDKQLKEISSSVTTDIQLAVQNHITSSQNGIMVLVDKSKNELDKSEVTSMEEFPVELSKISKVSPPPTPPPAYHPTPPPSRKTLPSVASVPLDELQTVQEEIHVVESCWPPPPPPLEGDSVFDGADEVDFPPPPPPFVIDSLPDGVDICMTKLDVSEKPAEEAQQIDLDSSKAEVFVHGQIPDLLSPVPQPVVTENKQEVVLEVLKANTADEISCQPLQNVSSVSDSIPPPPVEAPLPSLTRAENQVTVSALVPSSSFLRRDSLKIEDQSPSELPVSVQPQAPITIPVAPPLPADNLTNGVNFRRQPAVGNRDTRSKELLSRHKSAPIPKEDANIPLVTPSLLQMVRLRSVNMSENEVKDLSEDKPKNEGAPVQENSPVSIPGPQSIPQKPIRKSLSLKSPPQTVKSTSATLNTPSVRLQEAIRMKTAAMSTRDGIPSRLGVRSPTSSYIGEPGAVALKSPEGCDMHKSPASTASFIFSRSTKKVMDTAAASSPDAQASLTQSLAAEQMQVSDQSRAVAFSNGGLKCDKVPPRVAKKPPHGRISPSKNHPAYSGEMEFVVEGNGAIGQVQHMSGITPETTTRVTVDTIETLF